MNNLYKKIIIGVALAMPLYSTVHAEDIFLYDDSFSVGNAQGSLILSARWGVWDGSSFTQAVTSSAIHSGYVDLSSPEITVDLSQTDNTIYPQNQQFALAVFTDGSSDAQTLNWPSATYAAILTDSSWLAPAFSDSANTINFTMTSSTSAVLGTYAYNGGNDVIGLSAVSAVPEPTTYGFLLGVVALSLTIFQRRRRAVV